MVKQFTTLKTKKNDSVQFSLEKLIWWNIDGWDYVQLLCKKRKNFYEPRFFITC